MDPQGFTALVQQHLGLIHKVARAYCRNAADLDDLAQEIVLQLWRSRESYDRSRRASTWFYRVALNVAISYYRRERRHRGPRRMPADALIHVATSAAEPDPEVCILQDCIGELGELERSLVLLYLDGHDHAAIAEVLGISTSNVGTKLSRIKTTLKRAFERRAARTENA